MIGVVQAFPPSYARARVAFLEAASRAGLLVASHRHPLPGREGEDLALDLALDGDARAERLLIITSACHGVEGLCGSGVQTFALYDDDWREKARAARVAVLYVHALNPWGFSHLRRTTHENVDLNRNFLDFSCSLPANPDYAALHPLLVPAHWPPDARNEATLAAEGERLGRSALQAAISRGQHSHPDGLFFSGRAPTWSHLAWRGVLREHARHAARIAWIDLHTGLGPSGIGERIFACRDEARALVRARAWWGAGVTSIYDGSSTSARLDGLALQAVYDECPQAEYTGIALEYGTVPFEEALYALRGDQWLAAHPDAEPALASRIKADMLRAFFTDTDAWKGQVISQARQAMFQAVDGLQ